MGFKLILLLSILSSVCANKILISPIITNYGEWGNWQRCPFGTYAQGFQLKTEPYLGLFEDDSASNAFRLYCGDPANATTTIIFGTESEWGNWGNTYSCRSDSRPLPPDGYISGFQLRVEGPQGPADDTATNNIRVFCSYPNGIIEQMKEGDGLTYGSWSAAQQCNQNQAVCAIQTQNEAYLGDGDDTALNNVSLECCDR